MYVEPSLTTLIMFQTSSLNWINDDDMWALQFMMNLGLCSTVSQSYRQSAGHLRREISLLPTQDNTNIHASSGI
jgi:hypothetical protein